MADQVNHLAMTAYTIVLKHISVEFLDANGFVEIAGCKRGAMMPTVKPLCDILENEAVGDMTIVAGGNGFMAAVVPAFVDIAHNVAVETCFRVITHVRQPLGIAERVDSDTSR